jgi:hypothetical protein
MDAEQLGDVPNEQTLDMKQVKGMPNEEALALVHGWAQYGNSPSP